MMNFLTHKELEITEKEYDALIKVEALLRSGEIPYEDSSRWSNKRFSGKTKVDPDKMYFNMSEYGATSSCGTVGCIGGWVSHFMSGKKMYDMNMADSYVSCTRSAALSNLYYPSANGWNADSQEAARVIRHFLETGEVDWEKSDDN